jgi:hypothetical protein
VCVIRSLLTRALNESPRDHRDAREAGLTQDRHKGTHSATVPSSRLLSAVRSERSSMRHVHLRLVTASLVTLAGFIACESKERPPRTSPASGTGLYSPNGGAQSTGAVIGTSPTTNTTAVATVAVNAVVTVTTTSGVTSPVTGPGTSAATTTVATTSTAPSGMCGGFQCSPVQKCITNVNGDFCSDGTVGQPCAFNSDCASSVCSMITLSCE